MVRNINETIGHKPLEGLMSEYHANSLEYSRIIDSGTDSEREEELKKRQAELRDLIQSHPQYKEGTQYELTKAA